MHEVLKRTGTNELATGRNSLSCPIRKIDKLLVHTHPSLGDVKGARGMHGVYLVAYCKSIAALLLRLYVGQWHGVDICVPHDVL